MTHTKLSQQRSFAQPFMIALTCRGMLPSWRPRGKACHPGSRNPQPQQSRTRSRPRARTRTLDAHSSVEQLHRHDQRMKVLQVWMVCMWTLLKLFNQKRNKDTGSSKKYLVDQCCQGMPSWLDRSVRAKCKPLWRNGRSPVRFALCGLEILKFLSWVLLPKKVQTRKKGVQINCGPMLLFVCVRKSSSRRDKKPRIYSQ